MTTATQRVQAIRLEEFGLLRRLEETREQIRLLQSSAAILQTNLSTVRAKIAGIALAEEAAVEAKLAAADLAAADQTGRE